MTADLAPANGELITRPADLAMVRRTDFTADQVDLLRRTLCAGASNDELSMFLAQCRRTGLDPFARQIYLVKRQGKMCIQVGIDGYRLIADRTGLYAGNDDPAFDDEDKPQRASVTVYKLVGTVRCPFTATARWSQYFPGDAQGFMWKKMPHLMLGKCAEALALRKAFPAELSGLYIAEEMAQAGQADPVIDVPPAKPAPALSAEELDAIRAKWKRFFDSDPPVGVFNDFCASNWDEVPAAMRGNLSKAIDAHAVKAGWAWDGETRSYTRGTP